MDPLTESFKIISVLTVASFSRTTTVCPSGSLKAADVSMGQPAVMHISPTLDMTSPIKRAMQLITGYIIKVFEI